MLHIGVSCSRKGVDLALKCRPRFIYYILFQKFILCSIICKKSSLYKIKSVYKLFLWGLNNVIYNHWMSSVFIFIYF